MWRGFPLWPEQASTVAGEKLAAAYGWTPVFSIGIAAGALAMVISAGTPEAVTTHRPQGADKPAGWLALSPLLGASVESSTLFKLHKP